jgi:hypothetical protein
MSLIVGVVFSLAPAVRAARYKLTAGFGVDLEVLPRQEVVEPSQRIDTRSALTAALGQRRVIGAHAPESSFIQSWICGGECPARQHQSFSQWLCAGKTTFTTLAGKNALNARCNCR